ncbi:tyrosine-type recombinase/integrase [Nocardia kruczakiae]|uniref:tyrosine-type recombinase/integrase n=1 Tax=Nocardia kruczakiae TaxID=261477 RepID=UPI0007A39AA4|nr:tyrosine-type recombinase/integrase [Nocardia kruczakiae]
MICETGSMVAGSWGWALSAAALWVFRYQAAVRQRFREIGVEAGVPRGFTWHDLRHFYASALIAKGASVKTVRDGTQTGQGDVLTPKTASHHPIYKLRPIISFMLGELERSAWWKAVSVSEWA